MSELFELVITGEGEVRDADGNLLNQNPQEPQPVSDTSEER